MTAAGFIVALAVVVGAGLAYAWVDFANKLLANDISAARWGLAALWLAATVAFGALAFLEETTALQVRPAVTVAPVIGAVQDPLPVLMALWAGVEVCRRRIGSRRWRADWRWSRLALWCLADRARWCGCRPAVKRIWPARWYVENVLALVAANLRRRTARTFLTAAGVAVGVAAVVALLALSAGLNQSAAQFVHLGGADLGLFQRDAGDPTSSVLPLSLLPRVRAQPEVAEAAPLQLLIGAVRGDSGAIVLGLDPGSFPARQLVITAGRGLAAQQAVVGDLLAGQLHLRPGSLVTIDGRRRAVAGVFHTGLSYEDSGAVLTLRDAQAIAGRAPSEATTFAVKLRPLTPAAQAERELKRAFPGLVPIDDPGQAVRAGASTVLISKAVLLMVVLALLIGGLAVANTMLAALIERRRELALLATIGWSAPQLGGLVLTESLAVSMLGTGVGVLLGLAASKLLPGALGLGGFISPALTAWGVGRAALIGVAIGTLGALYPIWRVTRMRSVVALALT